MAANAVFDDAVFDAAVFGGRADLFGSEYDPLVFDTDAAPSVLTATLVLTDEDDQLTAAATVESVAAPAPPPAVGGGGGWVRWDWQFERYLSPPIAVRFKITDDDDQVRARVVPARRLKLQLEDEDDAVDAVAVVEPWPSLRLVRATVLVRSAEMEDDAAAPMERPALRLIVSADRRVWHSGGRKLVRNG